MNTEDSTVTNKGKEFNGNIQHPVLSSPTFSVLCQEPCAWARLFWKVDSKPTMKTTNKNENAYSFP